MKISLNTILGLNKRYGATGDIAKIGPDKLVEKIGAQLGAVEEVLLIGEKYHGIVIVKVVSSEKHPDADKLSVCTIDDGKAAPDVERDQDGFVQVVCGAPNVRAGMLAAWLPPGSTVPATVEDDDPFVLEARELRGVVSNGMLASPKELSLGDNHEGILEVTGEYEPGSDFASNVGLREDIVIDIENKMFTHRPDCFGFLGVSRELAGIQGMAFKSPDWYGLSPKFPAVEGEELELTVTNKLPKLVPRFTAIAMSDIKVGPSPLWLQVYLAEVGVKSINNIVDYTNWFMLETGQPLHAYDYDKLKEHGGGKAEIIIRKPEKGEKLELLNGKLIEPNPDAIMIASAKGLIGIGGVMGGTDTEVDGSTRNIVLECANFDMYSIRRTSMAHGLFTDAVTRFTKGQSPLQNPAVAARVVEEIRAHAGGRVASRFIDDNHVDKAVLERGSVYAPVKVSADFINGRLGLELSPEDIATLLENVEFKVASKDGKFTVSAPFWRTDIEIPEDVVEEVGRLYGYDRLPLVLPERDLAPAPRDALLDTKAAIRSRLAKAGGNEVLTYSFVHGDLLDKTGQDPGQAFQIANALSPDLQYYRMSLMPSLLDKVHSNIKAGYDEFALFELGRTHGSDNGTDDEGLPREFEFTALVAAAADKLKKPGAAYYQARRYLTELAGASLRFKPVGKDAQKFAVVRPYDPGRSAMVSLKDGTYLGIIGEFRPSVARALKLPKYCAGFELDTTALMKVVPGGGDYVPLSRFPKVTQDMTLKVASTLAYQELAELLDEELGKTKPKNAAAAFEPLDIYQDAKDAAHKHVTFRLSIASYERTLTDAEVNKLLDTVAAAARSKFKAQRI